MHKKTKEQYRIENTFIIDLGKDFSLLPSGRVHTDDGRYSAEHLFVVIADVLDNHGYVEIRFNNILFVGSSFLDHLAEMIVVNYYSDYVTLTSDDEWVLDRWSRYSNKYIDKYNRGEL